MKDMGKKFKKWAAMGLLYTAFCAVFMAPILIPLKKEMEEKRVAKLAAEQRREESRRTEAALKAIGAMAQEYPQRSETMAENEIPKIVRGERKTLPVVDVSHLQLPPGTSVIFDDAESCEEPHYNGMDVISWAHEAKELKWTISKKGGGSVAGEGYFDFQNWTSISQEPFQEKGWEAGIPPALEGTHSYDCDPGPPPYYTATVTGVGVDIQVHEAAPAGVYVYQLVAGIPGAPNLYAGNRIEFEVVCMDVKIRHLGRI